jgi:hypothetical protein
MPVSYGRELGTDDAGAVYQSGARSGPPIPRKLRASDWPPKDPWNLANEMAGATYPYSSGDQAPDAVTLGYGSHGRMGEDDEADDVDMDDLRKTFRSMIPVRELPSLALGLLSIQASAGEGDDSDDGCDVGILSGGDDDGDEMHVFAPDAENDPETL